MNRIKLLMVLFMSTLLLLASQHTFRTKSDAVVGIYSDLFFTRLAVETQQYTRQIEYGLENGKSLDSFYNIQTILTDVRRCSSYINGAYIVSDSLKVLYALDDNEGSKPTAISTPSADSIYSVYNSGDRYLMSLPICGKTGEIAGYLVLDLSESAISNSVTDFNEENTMQTLFVCILAFMAGSVFIIHKCRDRRNLYLNCSKVTAITICSAVFIDSAISVIKLQTTLESMIQQSVSKIVMAFNNDLDTLVEKGISVSRIYDLNSWLLESCQQIPFIENLIYDKNYKISAIIVSDYSTNQVVKYALVLAELVGICAIAGALLCLLGMLGDKYIMYKQNKKLGVLNNADKERSTAINA